MKKGNPRECKAEPVLLSRRSMLPAHNFRAPACG